MAVSENILRVRRTARYYRIGPGSGFEHVWFVFHGYGQLAGHFVQHFSGLSNNTVLVVAPEALSRFYLAGFSGRVGATWMTKEDRLHEIEDYVAYLDAVYDEVTRQSDAVAHITVLGFSQGVATAVRWVHAGKVKPQRLVLWGDLLPPELIRAEDLGFLKECGLTLVHGKQDKLVTAGRLKEQERLLQEHGVPFEFHHFDGGHELNTELLRELSEGHDS